MKYLMLLLLCIFSASHAGVYKWTDKNGKVHYGDRPNSNQATEVTIKPSSSPNGAPKETIDNQKAIDNWLKARDVDRQENKKKEAERAKEKAIQKQKCNELRTELADLEKGGVVWYDLDETGKRRFYSDKEIAQKIEAFRKTIKRNCR